MYRYNYFLILYNNKLNCAVIIKIFFMHIFLGLFVYMLSSSLLMVGYVLIRDMKHKKSQPAVIANADNEHFEEVKPAETTLTEYPDLRQKTA